MMFTPEGGTIMKARNGWETMYSSPPFVLGPMMKLAGLAFGSGDLLDTALLTRWEMVNRQALARFAADFRGAPGLSRSTSEAREHHAHIIRGGFHGA
ncbi:Hypothetical protein A7982_05325 [Minicystis rosea]|nr:Hypothetical protein A7982_05325 [Minicystis rosea]